MFCEGTSLAQREDLDILRGLGNELGVWGGAGMQFRAPSTSGRAVPVPDRSPGQ